MPGASALPHFDEVAQTTVWPLQDESGQWIGLTVEHGKASEGLAADVEKLGALLSLAQLGVSPIAADAMERLSQLGNRFDDLGLPPHRWRAATSG